MATDPTRSVKHIEHDTELTANVDRRLRRLASLPPSTDIPYLTVSVDWRIEGTNPGRSPQPDPDGEMDDTPSSRRPSRRILDQQMSAMIDDHGPRGPVFNSLSADAERIGQYLDSELDPSANGVFIVACAAQGVFEPIALGIPLPTRLSRGPTPALGEFVRVVDDHPPYAVLLADQHNATLSFITLATMEQSVSLESSGYPRKQQQGGWSQRRYQARADERVDAFARDIAEETRKALDELDVGMLIVAGDEVITSALNAAFHQTVTARIVATLRMDIRTSEHDLLIETMPVAEQAERDREAAEVSRLLDAIGAAGHGAGGADDTLTALQAGQVDTLIMNDDFTGSGWADFSLPIYGVGEIPAQHPLGGDKGAIVPIALEDELVRLALQTDARVEVVHSSVPVKDAEVRDLPEAHGKQPRTKAAVSLDQHGGVGAILRFVMDEDTPPESV